MMRNPYDCFPEGDLVKILKTRILILQQRLPFSGQEIIDWSIVYTLIATSWSLQDHGEIPADHIDICRKLAQMRLK